MSRGRHAQPPPPRSDKPLLALALFVAAAVVAAVWLIEDTWALQVGITGVVLLAVVGIWAVARSASRVGQQVWSESVERRRDLAETHHELSELKAQHIELLFELRAMRAESTQMAAAAEQLASDDAEQLALMRQLMQPRQPVLDPVYPSLHLPLVRAAFSTELPAGPIATPRPMSPRLQRESTTGGEPHPPRQLLDLTASEIAQLRPAN